jgi:hypothetical protein
MTEQTKHDRIFLHSKDGELIGCVIEFFEDDVEYILKELHDEQIADKDAEITALKIQLLNRGVSNMEASANFALTELQQQLAAKDALLRQTKEALERSIERMHFSEPWSAAEVDIVFAREALTSIDKELCNGH